MAKPGIGRNDRAKKRLVKKGILLVPLLTVLF